MLAELVLKTDNHRVVVVSGPNGSGKSTLLAAYQRYLFKNKIRFGVLSQHDDQSEEISAKQLFDLAGVDAGVTLSALGVEGLLNKELSLCSSGEKAKLKLALALSFDVVVLDEPLAHLDAESKSLLENLVRSSPSQFVIANHEPEFFKFASVLKLTARS